MKQPKDKRTKEYKEWLEQQPKGLGDVVEKITKATGVKKLIETLFDDCGCAERQELLNNMFPIRFKPRCLTLDEYKEYKTFRDNRTMKMDVKQIEYISKLFASVFNRQYVKLCPTCGGTATTLIGYIDKLDKVFESYEL